MRNRTRNTIYTTGAVLGGAVGLSAAWLAGRVVKRVRGLSLENRVVLITGGTRGFGLAMAEEFAAHGARLVLCSRDEPEMQRAREWLRHRGAEVHTIRCDVTERAQVESMVRETVDRLGSIDVLVNNAGQIMVGPLETQQLEDFEHAMDVMFWAHLYAVLAVIPHMRHRGGSIVNITSIGGKIAVPHLLPYCCAKFAAVGLSEGLTSELARKGIRVTTVVPGLMRTGSHLQAEFKGASNREFSWFALGASSPITAISAHHAASRVVHAVRFGTPEITLGRPAQLARMVHGLFPGATQKALGVVHRFMPGSNSTATESSKGHHIDSFLKNSRLTRLGREAAGRLNQEPVNHEPWRA